MKRWSKKRPLRSIKRGASAFLICAIVALPLILTGWQWSKIVKNRYSRTAAPLPAMQIRQIDNGSAPLLFNEPLITVTFDDGWESVYKTAMPELQKYGIRTTQYILSGTENYPGYMSWSQLKTIQKAGHEIACHSISHPDLTTLADDELNKQLQGCESEVGKKLGPARNFASPYGSYNSRTIDAVKKTYGSQRNINGVIADGISDADINLPSNFDKYNIIGVTVRRETTVAELEQLVNYAAARNGWLVLTYHQADGGPSQYGIDPMAMDRQLEYLSNTPFKIVTVSQVIDSLKNQKAGS